MSPVLSSVWANRLRVVIAAALLVAPPLGTARCAEPGSAPIPTTLTLEDMRTAILAAHDRIKSVYVECRCDYPDNGKYPKGTALYRTIACKRPGMFFCSTAKGHARLDCDDDPRWQRCYVARGKWYWEFVLWRAYSEGEIASTEPLPGSTQSELFLLATAIWPFDERVGPRFPTGNHAALRDVAKDSVYSLRPAQEFVDGHWCHVLQAPNDTIWIDVKRGCSVLARDVRQKETGALASRFELWDHRQVAEGVWLPQFIRCTRHALGTGDQSAHVAGVSVVRVVASHANDVNDNLFQFEAPQGALRLSSSGAVQTQRGGRDHLDDLARWVLRTGLGPRKSRAAWTPPVAFAAGTVLGLVAIVLATLSHDFGIWWQKGGSKRSLENP